ncbi:MAG: hypothetical protein V3R87_07280 [Dehalococcoidia bacterium]
MERWLLTVESNSADPAREKELHEWYDTIHLPDILETPGFVRAARYENTSPSEGQGKFLAMYEIETDDLGHTMAQFGKIVDRKAAQGRMSDLVIAVGGGLYRQITPPMEGK